MEWEPEPLYLEAVPPSTNRFTTKVLTEPVVDFELRVIEVQPVILPINQDSGDPDSNLDNG